MDTVSCKPDAHRILCSVHELHEQWPVSKNRIQSMYRRLELEPVAFSLIKEARPGSVIQKQVKNNADKKERRFGVIFTVYQRTFWTWKWRQHDTECLSFLSALFFYLFNETFQLTFFVAKLLNEWKDKSNKVYILTNVERLRKYAEYANFRQTDPHCTCKSDTKDNAKVRFTWSTAHTTIWRML